MNPWKPYNGGWYDSRDSVPTEPLPEPTPPTPKPLAQVLVNGVTWANNGYYTVHLTDLGTLHVLTWGTRDYCASDIDDLHGYLQGIYNDRLAMDFDEYINKGQLYSVKEPVWIQTEAI